MDTTEHNFHLEEYKQLRTEVTGLLSRIELLFRYSLLVSATVFAWLLSNSMGLTQDLHSCIKLPKVLLAFGWLIPPAFVLCAGLMAATTNTRVTEIGEYLRKLEVALGNQALGWQLHLGGKKDILKPMTERVWWLLLGITGATAATGLWQICSIGIGCPPK